MIRLETVTPDNWRLRLEVREDQRGFVADKAVLLARAYAYREYGSRAFIIYNDDTPIGMAMYYIEPGYPEYDLSQFFIDARYQGKGYGFEAAKLVLDSMREDGRFNRVTLCYIKGDEPARRLYEKLGFRETDVEEEADKEDEEIVMAMDLR